MGFNSGFKGLSAGYCPMYGLLILPMLLVTGTIRARMHLRLLYYKFYREFRSWQIAVSLNV